MKTPEEIKKGLECCSNATVESCDGCPYHTKEDHSAVCIVHLTKDAKVLLAQAERERDAAVYDIAKLVKRLGYGPCRYCRKTYDTNDAPCSICVFEWRGVCEENTKEDER